MGVNKTYKVEIEDIEPPFASGEGHVVEFAITNTENDSVLIVSKIYYFEDGDEAEDFEEEMKEDIVKTLKKIGRSL